MLEMLEQQKERVGEQYNDGRCWHKAPVVHTHTTDHNSPHTLLKGIHIETQHNAIEQNAGQPAFTRYKMT
jgi:hypothetical protein